MGNGGENTHWGGGSFGDYPRTESCSGLLCPACGGGCATGGSCLFRSASGGVFAAGLLLRSGRSFGSGVLFPGSRLRRGTDTRLLCSEACFWISF